ncbi:MAG TPA: rhomboid family intramembrane serine protease [Ilumatobacteraceae bacterium]|nr:rhomboid family intramembrane serine protease [Ilumatobacteraceae bacterium]
MSTLPPPPSGQANIETSEPGMCFRHPRREAGRRCTRCGRWACTECLVQANVGSHCVECAKAAKPDVKTRAKYWSARQMTLVTFAIMAVNALVFLYVAALDPESILSRDVTKGQIELGLSADIIDRGIPPVRLLDGSVYSADPGQWYRIVTSGFLHFGIIHLAFNMYLLYMLGQLLEPAIGRIRFGLVYIASLLGGSAGAMLMQPDGLHGGASGAVFGLMTAAFVGYMLRGINPLTTGIGTTLLLNVVITFSIPGISKGGHIGGAVAGALCGLVVLAPGYKRYPTWMSYAVPAAVAVISVVATVYAIQN